MAISFSTGLVLYVISVDLALVFVTEAVLSSLYNTLLCFQLQRRGRIKVHRNKVWDFFSGWSLGDTCGIAVGGSNLAKALLFAAVAYTSSTIDPLIVDVLVDRPVNVTTPRFATPETILHSTSRGQSGDNGATITMKPPCIHSNNKYLNISHRFDEVVEGSDEEGCSREAFLHLLSCFDLHGGRMLYCPEDQQDWAPEEEEAFLPVYDVWQQDYRGGMLACLRDGRVQEDSQGSFLNVDCVHEKDGSVRFFSMLEGWNFSATSVSSRYINGMEGVREYQGTLAPKEGQSVRYEKSDLVNSFAFYCLRFLNKPPFGFRSYVNWDYSYSLGEVSDWLHSDSADKAFEVETTQATKREQTTLFVLTPRAWTVLALVVFLTVLAAAFNAWSRRYAPLARDIDSFEAGLDIGKGTANEKRETDGTTRGGVGKYIVAECRGGTYYLGVKNVMPSESGSPTVPGAKCEEHEGITNTDVNSKVQPALIGSGFVSGTAESGRPVDNLDEEFHYEPYDKKDDM